MKNHILLVFSLLVMQCLPAQDIKLDMDKTSIVIGEQIRMNLQAEFKREPVSWVILDSIPHFEILNKSKVDTTRNGNLLVLRQSLTLTSFDSGQWNIPPIIIGGAKTKPVPIQVGFSKMDYNQPYHDIKDIIQVKRPIESTWHWYLILLAVIILLFVLFFPREKAKKTAEFVPDEGAYKAALRKLEQLKTAELKDNKELYTELIHIFREYLEKRRNIRSFSKTTDDLSIRMSELGLPKEQFAELVQTLRLGDLVKFAQFQPSGVENENSIRVVQQNIIAIENLS